MPESLHGVEACGRVAHAVRLHAAPDNVKGIRHRLANEPRKRTRPASTWALYIHTKKEREKKKDVQHALPAVEGGVVGHALLALTKEEFD